MGEISATAGALLLVVLDADQQRASDLLGSLSKPEVAATAARLAVGLVVSCEPEDRLRFRASLLELLQSGRLLGRQELGLS